jgi:LacI family transcriptional regulator
MAMAEKRVTLKDVAERAGVSVGMAGRVMGEYGSFSDTTRRKVEAAARELAYRPNALARSLRSGRSKALGLTVTNLASFHWITFVRGVESAAASYGYQVILGHTGDDPARERDHIRALHERNVDGLIMTPTAENEDRIRKLVADGFPVVLVESAMADVATPRINIADRRGSYEATSHLIGLGHRRIGIVAGEQALSSGSNRLRGYLDALRDRGLEPEEALIAYGEYRFDLAFAATDRLMTMAKPPTALLVSNETMLGATLQCLKELKVRIPDDVSLIGFDDPPWAAFFSPGLTTIRTPRERMGAMAVHTLMTLIGRGAGSAAGEERLVSVELVIRESCRTLG